MTFTTLKCDEISDIFLCKGGVPKGPQEGALWKGVHIVVATPGRLKDLMNQV